MPPNITLSLISKRHPVVCVIFISLVGWPNATFASVSFMTWCNKAFWPKKSSMSLTLPKVIYGKSVIICMSWLGAMKTSCCLIISVKLRKWWAMRRSLATNQMPPLSALCAIIIAVLCRYRRYLRCWPIIIMRPLSSRNCRMKNDQKNIRLTLALTESANRLQYHIIASLLSTLKRF